MPRLAIIIDTPFENVPNRIPSGPSDVQIPIIIAAQIAPSHIGMFFMDIHTRTMIARSIMTAENATLDVNISFSFLSFFLLQIEVVPYFHLNLFIGYHACTRCVQYYYFYKLMSKTAYPIDFSFDGA